MWRDSHGAGNRRRPKPALELFLLLRQFWKTLQPPEEVVSLNHRRAHQDLLETCENDGQHYHCGVGDHAVEGVAQRRVEDSMFVSSTPQTASTQRTIGNLRVPASYARQ